MKDRDRKEEIESPCLHNLMFSGTKHSCSISLMETGAVSVKNGQSQNSFTCRGEAKSPNLAYQPEQHGGIYNMTFLTHLRWQLKQ